MCLGIPMQIVNIDGLIAQCNAKGIEREVNLYLMQNQEINIGDYVLVHVGYALQKIAASDAQTTWQLLDQMLDDDMEKLHRA